MTAVAVQEFRYAIKGYNVLSAALVDNPLASGIPTIGAKLQREKEAEEQTENQSRRRYCTYFPTMKTSATAAALLTGLLLIYCEVQYGHAKEDDNFESEKQPASLNDMNKSAYLGSPALYLVGYGTFCRGFMRMRLNGTWANACQRNISNSTLNALCREIGCGPYTFHQQPELRVIGPAHELPYNCTDSEVSLNECPRVDVGCDPYNVLLLGCEEYQSDETNSTRNNNTGVDCGHPGSLENGEVKVNHGTRLGARIHYACNLGYSFEGSHTIRECGANGKWTETEPTCIPASICPTLNTPPGASLVALVNVTGELVAYYACDGSARIVGQNYRTCKDGNWTGNAVKCIVDADCEPGNITNGKVRIEKTGFFIRAYYSCDRGYILNGTTSTTCMSNGEWGNAVPTCHKRKECPPVPDLPFRRESIYDRFVHYTCYRGYITTGPGFQTCSYLTGEWTPEATTCENGNVTCPRPSSSFSNGSVNIPDEIVVDSRVTYDCYRGYATNGTSSRTCTLSGEWSSPEPTCRRTIRCSNPRDLQNGISRVYSNYLAYECNPGYELRGSSSRICGIFTGEWRGYTPTCLKSNVDCGPPQNVTNGTVQAPRGTELRNRAHYTCNSGFYRLGSSYRTCESSGNWSGFASTCQPKKTCPTQIQNGILEQVSDNILNIFSTFRLRCDEGFESNGTQIYYYCDVRTGQWLIGEPAACQKTYHCKWPPTIRNGLPEKVDTNRSSIVRYSCNEGYFHKGRNYIECLANLTWSEPAPECIAVDCGDPDKVTNGRVDVANGTTFGSLAKYSCNKGFAVNGNGERECTSSGEWSSIAPTCQEIDCGELKGLKNGKVTTIDGTTYGGRATYTCHDGYRMVGSPRRRCKASGKWSGRKPRCKQHRRLAN